MSNFEFNAGKLMPVELYQEDIVKMCITYNGDSMIPTWCDTWNEYFDEYSYEMGFVKINGKWYKIIEHTCSEDFDGRVYHKEDGTIEFLTYHYNGGGFWTEVLKSIMLRDNIVSNNK